MKTRTPLCEIELVKTSRIVAPEVSIIITTYDRPDTLRETLLSALSQETALPYEIVISDNKGSLETRTLVASFNSDKITYYVNKENIGPERNWNQGMIHARGRYFTILHDDDTLAPGWMTRAFSVMKKHGFDAYFCRAYSGPTAPQDWEIRDSISEHHVSEMVWENMTAFPGVLFPSAIIDEIGYFDEHWRPCTDYVYWIKLASSLRLGKDKSRLAFYRKNSAQDTVTVWKDIITRSNQIITALFHGYGFSPKLSSRLAAWTGAGIERIYRRMYDGDKQVMKQLNRRRRTAKLFRPLISQVLKRRTLNFNPDAFVPGKTTTDKN